MRKKQVNLKMVLNILLVLTSVFISGSQQFALGPSCKECLDYWPPLPICSTSNTDVSYYYSDASRNNVEIKPSDQCIFDSSINAVVLEIHGWLECSEKQWCQDLKDNLIAARPNTGVVIVDWRNGSDFVNYFKSAGNVKAVGNKVAAELVVKYLMNTCGFKIDSQLICVGNSLGAQVCGVIGKWLKANKYPMMYKIVATEPAEPGYFSELYSSPLTLTSADAKYVDVLHCASILGICKPIGTTDYYLNDGEFFQPGCSPFKIFDSFNYVDLLMLLQARSISPIMQWTPFLNTVICGHLYCVYQLADAVKYALAAVPCYGTSGSFIEFGNNTIFNDSPGIYTVATTKDLTDQMFKVVGCPPPIPSNLNIFNYLLGQFCI